MQKDVDLMRAEIFRGRQHRLVFMALEGRGLMISEIMRKINKEIEKTREGKSLTLRETSRALKWLAKKDYAECLNPSSEHGVKRIVYRISNKGKKIKSVNYINF